MGRHKDGRHNGPAFEKYKKARQDMHPRFSQRDQGSSRRPSRATRGAPQYREGGDGTSPSSLSSNDDETEDYRVEHRKRKSTDRDLDIDSPDDEEEAPSV
jgi:hypothetical protein